MRRRRVAFAANGMKRIIDDDLICSPAQIRLALHRAGKLAQVEAIANADPEANIVWEYATEIHRDSPLIAAMGGQLFTEAEIDNLFLAAMDIDL
jgi:hypothetical protein